MLDLLLSGLIDKFAETFPPKVMESLSYFDVGGTNSTDKAENFYHAFTLGLLVAARDRGYDIRSNRESGLGRYDVLIVPQNTSHVLGVFLEFKVLRGQETLEVAAAGGLDQIEARKYRVGMPKHVETVVEMGIAFEGKTAMVKGRVLRKDNSNWKVVYAA